MSWLNQWGRSPRQDRRTVIDGKFVELAPPTPQVAVPEAEESALEIVTTEAQGGKTDEGTSAGASVLPVGATSPVEEDGGSIKSGEEHTDASEGVDGAIPNLALPTTEVSESEKLQAQLEPLPFGAGSTIAGSVERDYPF